MSKYLISVVENYRADSEKEAEELINDAKSSNDFVLSKYTSVHKEVKQKGEVIDEYQRVSLTKVFTSEKEPDYQVTPSYSSEEVFRVE